jgi:acetyl/propionyl-CoA carboxylase alpha subunit
MDGWAVPLSPPEFSHVLDALAGGDEIRAPMPGKVLDVKAVAGVEVKKGAALVVLEAMKMEHTLAAPRDGRIAEVSAAAGAQTAEGVVLVRLEPIAEG